MKVPKKIYLQVCGDCPQTDCKSCKFEDLEDNITWCKDRIFPKDIEYTRTDVVIEKAMKWLDKELPVTDLSSSNLLDIEFKVFDEESKRVFIEEFRKYMKGE